MRDMFIGARFSPQSHTEQPNCKHSVEGNVPISLASVRIDGAAHAESELAAVTSLRPCPARSSCSTGNLNQIRQSGVIPKPFLTSREETVGCQIYELGNPRGPPRLRNLDESVIRIGFGSRASRSSTIFRPIGRAPCWSTPARSCAPDDPHGLILLAIRRCERRTSARAESKRNGN